MTLNLAKFHFILNWSDDYMLLVLFFLQFDSPVSQMVQQLSTSRVMFLVVFYPVLIVYLSAVVMVTGFNR